MSNRYSKNHNRNEQNNNLPKTHKKFVPKQQTLSNSLRQSLSVSDDGAASSDARLSKNHSGNSKIQNGNFVYYLPQDDAVAAGLESGSDPAESQRVVDLLNKELSTLLRLNPRDFWKEVAADESFGGFLESFLKYRTRWYDFPYHGVKGIVAGVIVGEYELCRRVFMVLYRLSSNRDPGAKASDSLSPKDHAALLQEKKFLDLPKLLDICAIYGHENEDLTRILVVNAIRAQPWIHDDLTAVVSHFLSIVRTMYQRCSSSLEVLFSTGDRKDHGVNRLHTDYLEVMDFLNDAIVSMDAFVSAYKLAAVFFCCPVETSGGHEELLTTLARLHDSLLPSFQRAFRIILPANRNKHQETSSVVLPDVSVSLKMLSMRIVQFGWKLIYFSYLSDEAFEGNYHSHAVMKMFPATVEDPLIRADILVQSLREINREYLNLQEGQSKIPFLQNMENNHKILSRIEMLQNSGWLSMDDEQIQFLSGIMKSSLEANKNRTALTPSLTASQVQIDEDTAVIESKISQIKDLFPDYGKGFLAACLEVYNQNPEEVIQRILEGTLHEDLQSLDTSLDIIPPRNSVESVNRHDKGKKILYEPAEDRADMVPAVGLGPHQTAGTSSSSSYSVGRFIRKATTDSPDFETLDSRDEKDMAKIAALASQLEYEDEYDDSFDDLGLSVGDSGLEDSETLGNKLNSNHSKPRENDAVTSNYNASNQKWNSRKTPQFYVKDGKNYSYKVADSVAVANYEEASLVNRAQKEQIHGLGRGGNVPFGAVKRLNETIEDQNDGPESNRIGEHEGRGNHRGRGRRNHGYGRGGGRVESSTISSKDDQDDVSDNNEVGGRGSSGNLRGRGRRGGGRNQYRKDQAFKKHFSGMTGR